DRVGRDGRREEEGAPARPDPDPGASLAGRPHDRAEDDAGGDYQRDLRPRASRTLCRLHRLEQPDLLLEGRRPGRQHQVSELRRRAGDRRQRRGEVSLLRRGAVYSAVDLTPWPPSLGGKGVPSWSLIS